MRDIMHEIVPGTVEVIGGVFRPSPYAAEIRWDCSLQTAYVVLHAKQYRDSKCADVLEVYTLGNASVQFPLDVPFERTVLERRIMLRIREIG
jgi:hypothetical protein